MLLTRVKEFDLCPKLSGIQKVNGPCYDRRNGECLGACEHAEAPEEYNRRMNDLLDSFAMQEASFALIGPGRAFGEQSVVLVEEGRYRGFGYGRNLDYANLEQVIDPAPESAEIMSYIYSYVHHPDQSVIFLSAPSA
jgi:DNA polymerase-3 subunit epsilon